MDVPLPIRLGHDQNDIYTSDMTIGSVDISEVRCSDGYSCRLSDDGNVIHIVAQDHAPYMGWTMLSTDDGSLTVPIIKSQKSLYTFSLSDPNKRYKDVSIKGDMTAWKMESMSYEDGSWALDWMISPGQYGYLFVVDGVEMKDPVNKSLVSNNSGGYNSNLLISKPDAASLPFLSMKVADDHRLMVHSTLPVTQWLVFLDNDVVSDVVYDPNQIEIKIPDDLRSDERQHLRVWAYNEQGLSNDLMIPLGNGRIITRSSDLDRFDHHTQIMYFLMVDRFYNADPNNDEPEDNSEIHPLANHHGGDLKGIIKKLEDGYFEDLGMNTIWLSPIPKNPKGAYGLWDKGGVKSKFSAYHGYWPISFREIDARFGDSNDLKQLVQASHAKDKNVILDFVANHVHETHPVYQANKDDGWQLIFIFRMAV